MSLNCTFAEITDARCLLSDSVSSKTAELPHVSRKSLRDKPDCLTVMGKDDRQRQQHWPPCDNSYRLQVLYSRKHPGRDQPTSAWDYARRYRSVGYERHRN